METILLGVAVFSGLGLILGITLTYLSKVLYVEVDTRIEDINALLPGINCGGCGYPGCGGFAEAIIGGKVSKLGLCRPLSKDSTTKITEYLKKDSNTEAVNEK